jgi:hypothetical protein
MFRAAFTYDDTSKRAFNSSLTLPESFVKGEALRLMSIRWYFPPIATD